MMAAALRNDGLISRLPPVRGGYEPQAPLAKLTRFGVGGPAEILVHPADEDDLAAFLHRRPREVPVTVIGLGSNLLIRDGGVRGVVVRLGRGFAAIDTDGMAIRAGAAALDIHVARAAAAAAIGGLEFLSGVPGTMGAALRMNAGAYGREMADVTLSARALDGDGASHVIDNDGLGFSYRRCAVAGDWIFTEATVEGAPGDAAAIAARLAEIAEKRDDSQPVRTRTGGSTFKNPPGTKAWELIHDAGGRGLRRGGAMVSDRHCNFLVNTGGATAADLEGLGEEVRQRVLTQFGVELEWEIHRIGETGDAA